MEVQFRPDRNVRIAVDNPSLRLRVFALTTMTMLTTTVSDREHLQATPYPLQNIRSRRKMRTKRVSG